MEFLLNFIGAFLIWTCIDWKRDIRCELKLFSKDWWFVCIILIIATTLLKIKI